MTEHHNTKDSMDNHKFAQRAAGSALLGLLFFATATYTWSYLRDLSQSANMASAALAASREKLPADSGAFASTTVLAKSAIVVDETAGLTLFEKDTDVPLPLASLTKVALVLAVVDAVAPPTIVALPFDTAPNSHASAQLKSGQRWMLQNIIDYTLVASSNEGADMLAAIAEGSIRAKFSGAARERPALRRMNDLAAQLGLTRTYFLNDNGLDESPTQAGSYGSARDIAALFAYAATSSPAVFAATTQVSIKLAAADGAHVTVTNTDDALPAIPNMILGKTGYTDLAGGNLAVVFAVQGHLISAVVLGSTQDGRFEDMKALVDATQAALKINQPHVPMK